MKTKIATSFVSVLFILLTSCQVMASPQVVSSPAIQVCFTPGGECTDLVVDSINHAKNTILVQAYSFTSSPIAKALVEAKQRHVNVEVILDKSQFNPKSYSSSQYLSNQMIPVWIDYKPAIAHNKIMIIDDNTVITGSFNFTKAAQEKNAENLLIISDSDLANKYTQNWRDRLKKSETLADYSNHKKSKLAHRKSQKNNIFSLLNEYSAKLK